jgi:PAS domain S-box-containing protein
MSNRTERQPGGEDEPVPTEPEAAPPPPAGGAPAPAPPVQLLRDIFRHELLDQGPPLYISDLDGRFLWRNAAFRRLAASVEGPQPLGFVPTPEIAAELALLGSTIFREDVVARGPTVMRLRSRHVLLRDENGEPAAIAGIVQAMPDEASRLDVIAQLRERLDDIVRLVGDWVWESDADLVLTSVSPRVTELLGFHPRELVGRNLLNLGPVGATHSALAGPFRERSAFRSLPFQIAAKNGALRQILLSAVPVFSHSTGALVGFRGTASDVTELMRREEHLKVAKEMAESESRAKSDFLANMSHELRTPLNAIIGFAEIMQMELLGPVGNEQYLGYVRDIADSARHLLGLINDVLDVSKIEAGKADLIEQEVDLHRAVDSVARLMRERALRAQVELETDVPESLPPLLADDRKVKQILINLLSNAVKFTPAGGRVRVAARLDARGDLVVVVSDTGIGIAPDDIRRVMEPFGQAESDMHRRHDGTGLGLPLTRGLVELHGGAMTLDSAPGTGTTVTVRFPAARVIRRDNP